MNEVEISTKERILEAAERQFAARGVSGTSLRAVIRDAGVNLAAIHYHFGSKDALVDAVIARHFGPLNEERLRRLDVAEREAGDGPVPVERIVEAFLAPPFELADSETFMTLIGRLLAEPRYFFGRVAPVQFGTVRNRFLAAMRRSLPDLPPEDIVWRLLFSVGGMAFSMRVGDNILAITGGLVQPATPQQLIARLVQFASAGLRAAATEEAA